MEQAPEPGRNSVTVISGLPFCFPYPFPTSYPPPFYHLLILIPKTNKLAKSSIKWYLYSDPTSAIEDLACTTCRISEIGIVYYNCCTSLSEAWGEKKRVRERVLRCTLAALR